MDTTHHLHNAFRRGVEVREFLKPIIGEGTVTVLGDGAVFVEGRVSGQGVTFRAPLVDAILEVSAGPRDCHGESGDCGSPKPRRRGDGELSEMAVQHADGLGGTGMFEVVNGMFQHGQEVTGAGDAAVGDELLQSEASLLIEVALSGGPRTRKQLARLFGNKRLKANLAAMQAAGMIHKSGKLWHLVESAHEDVDTDGADGTDGTDKVGCCLVSCVLQRDEPERELMTHCMARIKAASEKEARQAVTRRARVEHPGYSVTSMTVHPIGKGEHADAAG